MQMSGEQRIAAPRERVWAALNDPEVLRRSIPGCQSLEKESDTAMRAVVEVKIGPIGAKFAGAVTLSDIDPPSSYTITGQGQGGTVGSARGGAKVRLKPDGNGTLLSYDVEAEVGGRLAQLGGPIIDATAKQLAAKFFKQFGAEVEGVAAPAAGAQAAVPSPAPAPVVAAPAPAPAPAPAGGTPWAWILAVVVALVAGYFMGLGFVGRVWLLLVTILLIVVAAAGYEAGKRGGPRP
jgi:carbon monoxide dehydrogenase subunit G